MARKIVGTPYFSSRVGPLAKGCRQCVRGEKLVLIATGVCPSKCWYCPLSLEKKGRDVVYANERRVEKDQDILEEALLCSAKGAGITGGDPLARLGRTVKYIWLLKGKFGAKFHIHLYTPGVLATPAALKKLHDAGLDEIRFHPDYAGGQADYSRMGGPDLTPIENALKYGWDVGVEIPVVPGYLRQAKKLVVKLDEIGVKFLNLNQLESSETNIECMLGKGFELESPNSFAVKGSARMAGSLLKFCAQKTGLNVHYCTIRLKDRVQLRERIRRRAKNVAQDFDFVTSEGLLVRGALYLSETLPSFGHAKKLGSLSGSRRKNILKKLSKLQDKIAEEIGLPENLMLLDERGLRILTGAWILEGEPEYFRRIGLVPAFVEEYPTWDGLITTLDPL
ncbi:MAG TPA: radical SAM protein [Candidatus Altiarchaeales archaeon]|nr:radical SAM protein [Candidatus Altiarchaeales archaeon]